MSSLKDFLKKVFPPSVKAFNREIGDLKEQLHEQRLQSQGILYRLNQIYNGAQQQKDWFEDLQEELNGVKSSIERQRNEINAVIQKEINKLLDILASHEKQGADIIGIVECLSQNTELAYSGAASRLTDIQRKLDGMEDIRRQIERGFNEQKDRQIRTTRLPILSFEVHLAEHCNLNCKGCDHFCPVAEPAFTDLAVFERDFQRLSELFHGEAKEIHLLGGEPLLNPDVESYCKVARRYFSAATINIITNGLLLPRMPDSFWECCRDYDITIRPTKYPVDVDYGCAERKAEQFGVKYIYFNDAQQIKKMTHNRYDLKGLQDPRESFVDCPRANKCIYLADGKLYPCTFAPNIHHFNKYFKMDLPVSDRDHVDIFKAASAEEILEFLSHPIPFCRFCNISDAELEQPWETSNKQIEEWI